MIANVLPTVTVLEAQANGFLLDHLPHCFTAGRPAFDQAAQVWRVPVLLAYATIGSLGRVGEVIISPTSEDVVSATSFEDLKAAAQVLYEQRRAEIEAPLP